MTGEICGESNEFAVQVNFNSRRIICKLRHLIGGFIYTILIKAFYPHLFGISRIKKEQAADVPGRLPQANSGREHRRP